MEILRKNPKLIVFSAVALAVLSNLIVNFNLIPYFDFVLGSDAIMNLLAYLVAMSLGFVVVMILRIRTKSSVPYVQNATLALCIAVGYAVIDAILKMLAGAVFSSADLAWYLLVEIFVMTIYLTVLISLSSLFGVFSKKATSARYRPSARRGRKQARRRRRRRQ